MNKLWLIIQREYLTRVRSRAFLLSTLLTPLAFGLFVTLQYKFTTYRGAEEKRIVVRDEGGFIKTGIPDQRGLRFTLAPAEASLESLKDEVRQKKYDGVLLLPPLANNTVSTQTIYYYSDGALSPEVERLLKNRVADKVKDYKMSALGLNKATIDALETTISLDPEPIDQKDKDATSITSGVAMGISLFIGILMYMIVLIYGSMVMRSVMEEKTNRVVEVIMSSVRPFQLMLGKIIGSAGVGTTQLILWAVLNTLVFIGVQSFLGIDPAAQAEMSSGASGMNGAQAQEMLPRIIEELANQNWWYIVGVSILYFIGGYFLYASLFAALGSAVGDDMGEGQSLTFPVMVPIILAFLIMSSVVMRAPDSGLSVFSSLFPFFSPIVMPGRLAFHPPLWQVGVSLLVLYATSVFFVWLSGRIYRVGILMYGKKVSMKEIWRWMLYS